MAPSVVSPVAPNMDGILRTKGISDFRHASRVHDGDTVMPGAPLSVQSAQATSRKHTSMGTTNISSVVSSLQRRMGEEIGSNTCSKLLTATHATILDWIRSERINLLPPEGSDYDKVLTWAQLFVDRLHSFDLEIGQFAGDSFLATQLCYGYCSILLELGRENASALMTSFGFFYNISTSLVNLLERTELFTVTHEIQEQLILALSDLVTLVASVSTHFHKAVRGMTTASVSINISRTFPSQIQAFQRRCKRIAESMWKYQLIRENLDGDRVSEVEAIRFWLAPEDHAVSTIMENRPHLGQHREQLTFLWMGPYLTRFLKTQQKHLSITAPPGSGKSVLTSVILDHLQPPHVGVSYQTLFVPIDSRVAVQASSHTIAKSILFQLLESRIGNVHLFRVLSDALNRSKVTADYETYDAIMWNAVDQALNTSLPGAKELVLVVDGVDEAACAEEKLLQRLTRATSKTSNTKLITLGTTIIPETPEQARLHVTEDLIFDDIAVVVRGCFARSHGFTGLSAMEQETAVERIAQASKSSFLFASMITERLRQEQSAENFRKALDSLLSAKPAITDIVLHALHQPGVTPEAKFMLLWLATAERPLHLKELSALASVQTDKHTISDKGVDPVQVLRNLDSVVVLQNEYYFLRHGLIRTAILDLFSQGKLTPTNVTVEGEPSSLPSLDYHDTTALLDKHPLLEFSVRYWVPIFRETLSFTKDGEPTASKEIAKVLPVSPTVVRLFRAVCDNVSTPELVTYQTSLTNVYRNVLPTENVATLQALITLSNLLRQVNRPEPFTLVYEAAVLSQKLLTSRHIVTMQMVTLFLELTTNKVTDSKTEIMLKREKMLLVLVECYKLHYGNTSDKVVTVMQQLVEHYGRVKDTQNAQGITVNIHSITSSGDGSITSGASGDIDVHLVGQGGKTDAHTGYILRLDIVQEDEVVESTESYEVEALIKLAETYLQNGRVDIAERVYVESWQQATGGSRVQSSAGWEEKKMKVLLAYVNFLRVHKKEQEAAAVLTSFWEDYQRTNVILSDSTVIHLQEIASVMKNIDLSTTALDVFKRCAEYYKTTHNTNTSGYKEVQQLLQTTFKEVMQSAWSTSMVSESSLEEMILETCSSTGSINQNFYRSTESLVNHYISQRRWKQATHTIERVLHKTWSALFAATYQDVNLPIQDVDFSLSLAERLAQCYHSRHLLTKEQDIRLRIYYAVRSGLKLDDKVRQHHVAELLRLLERTSQTDLIVSVQQDLLNDYTKHYGPEHPTVIQTLRTLAELSRPRPPFLDYYQQIIRVLNKDGKQCHPEALEPLDIVATELLNQERYPDSLQYCTILFTAFLNQPQLSPKFQDEAFVQGIFSRYTRCLRAVRTEVQILHKVTLDYLAKVKAVFGTTARITVQTTLALVQLCQESKQYHVEAIRLYEELLKIKSDVINIEEIQAALDALYEEQATIISDTALQDSASSAQVDQAVWVLKKRISSLRESYGWAHEESLANMKGVINFQAKQNKTHSVVEELQEATVQILSSKTSSSRLSQAAETIVTSYIATNQTQKAVELSEEVYRQVITKNTTNTKSFKFDLTSKSRESLIFLAQLEHHLRRQSSSVTEILASLTTELVYFEDFQRHIQGKSTFLSTSASAARLHHFLITNNRQSVATRVASDFTNYFLATEGKRIGFKAPAEVNLFVTMVLHYFSTRQSPDIVRSIGIASNSSVIELVKTQRYGEACDLALASFKYLSAQDSYRNPAIARFVLALSINVSGRGLKVSIPDADQKRMLNVSVIISQDVLQVLRELKINLALIGFNHLNTVIGLLGEQGDYPSLAMVLTSLWNSREAQTSWDPYITLSLGRLYVMARYLVGDTASALRLAEDIVYNCRRVHGVRHPNTLQMSVLLSQIYTGIGQRYQSQKDGHDLANRYYKRAAVLHENILRAMSDHTLADMDGSLDGGVSTDGSVSALSGDVGSELVPSDEQVRLHFKLFKLAVQRLGGWPKEYSEYEWLNGDLFREFPGALKGIEGVEKWNLKGFGAGKAESNEDLVDPEFKDWQLLSQQSVVDGVEEEL
ncbi:hypothetical protein BJX61DRAFT_552942 [Aspergillus egyptiacus]|nr:hypothetical protein BJX61DRAFT_552942 [Aspergillus egyptiacus]